MQEHESENDDTAANDSFARRLDRISWLCAILGVGIIFTGCFFSIALRDPGGSGVSEAQARWARMVAYIAFGLGGIVSILIPVALMVVQHRLRKSEGR